MDYSIYIDTISKELPSVYFKKGTQVYFSKAWCFMFLKVVLILANCTGPGEM